MSGWLALYEAAAAAWAGSMLRACWQGGLALAGVWVGLRLFSRVPPRLRCWLWRLAYLKLATALLWATPIDLPLRPAPSRPPAPRPIVVRPRHVVPPAAEPAVARPTPSESSAGRPTAVAGLFGLWLAGLGWSAARIARGWRDAQRLRRAAVPLAGGPGEGCCRDLCRRLGLRRRPDLIATREVGSPLLIGVARPAILVPEPLLAESSPEQLRLILAHELAHLRRLDLAWNWLPTLLEGLFFFHPLVWLARREWRLAQESACDELALEATGASAADYGRMLVWAAAVRIMRPASGPAAVGVSESYLTLKRRLNAMTHFTPLSRRRLRLSAAAVLVSAAALVVPWRLTHRQALAQDPAPAPPSSGFSVAPPGWAGPTVDLVTLANESTVQKELKLTAKQEKQLREILGHYRRGIESMFQHPRGEPPDPRVVEAGTREIQATTEKAILRLLQPRQLARMEQIKLQMDGPLAFLRPDVQRKLNMDPAQVELIVELVVQGREDLVKSATIPLSPEAADPEQLNKLHESKDFQDKMRQARRSAQKVGRGVMQQVETLLRKGQLATYRKMLGEPYDVTNMGGLPMTRRGGPIDPAGLREPQDGSRDGAATDADPRPSSK
jgi:beta-lactamase regulating signal transducer with metallopeptidase domain